MPHTNRKKKSSDGRPKAQSTTKKFSHSKRELIDGEDGWTQVADKGWKSVPHTHPHGGNMSVDMTLEEMREEYERHQKAWSSSDACAALKKLLETQNRSDKHAILNVVCLGLGSLQAISFDRRRTSHTQLAALQTIREILGELYFYVLHMDTNSEQISNAPPSCKIHISLISINHFSKLRATKWWKTQKPSNLSVTGHYVMPCTATERCYGRLRIRQALQCSFVPIFGSSCWTLSTHLPTRPQLSSHHKRSVINMNTLWRTPQRFGPCCKVMTKSPFHNLKTTSQIR